jgi:hypothetical protein
LVKIIGIVVVAFLAARAGPKSGGGYDHVDLAADEVGGQRGQPIIMQIGPAVFPRHVLALDEAHFAHSLVHRPAHQVAEVCRRREDRKDADHGHRLLLRTQHARRSHCAAEEKHELPPSHSMTSSRRKSRRVFARPWLGQTVDP